jgi:chromate transporter
VTAAIDNTSAPRAPTRAEAFRYWLRLGFVGFGGPAGQIAIMHRELVDERRWISERRFLHALNYCMVLPGPEAQQLATYIGWLLHRTWGGIVAGGLFVLPSLAILIALAWVYLAFGDVPVIAGLFYGVKPAVVAIVAHAAWRIGTRALRHPLLWVVAVAAFVAIALFRAPFPMIILGAAIIGAIGGRLAPSAFALRSPDRKGGAAHIPALIDDETPPPPHVAFARGHFVRVVAAFLAVWLAAIAALALVFGVQSTLAQMGWFFTKAALLTFGGAYAVLPYVFQGAVEHYGWLTAPQMIDGLALGETTPGPLIMVVAFVGFVGGWTKALFGPAALALAGVAGACTATFFTFLPSFLFILAGGPLVESTRGSIRHVAPLSGVTAAVVGVIANLALFFALHVFRPEENAVGWQLAGVDFAAVILALAAAVALFRFKVGVIPVIAGCALAGVAVRLTMGVG